ncbi:hypothetical protein ASZ90_003314 [hydrocarbon metagenome]|uniref:N-acetyltransferase domain-containing protein n=1 Tax=hydrocarbon metagenome TaxID=938273 RepID=A0A0W8G0Z1_9ZZZZ
MSSLNIIPVSSKSEFNKFLKFPWKIYSNHPNWVPPLLFDLKKVLNKKKNPFFNHADMELFLAIKEGSIVGRIAAIKNDLHNKEHNDKVGFFGFFECINDQEVANKLFDTAAKWITEKGLTVLRGPANPSVNDIYGLLIDGFEDPPRILMPYNPKYYMELLDHHGFQKAKDLYAWKISKEKMETNDKIKRVADIALRRSNATIRPLNMKDFNNELVKVKFVYNKAWEPNWGFVPLTDEEIDALAADLKPLVDPNLVLFLEIENKTVGFALTMPDYNFIFKEMNGRLLPFNFIKLFTKRKSILWARIIILGVIPEYQKRGLDAALYYEIMVRAEKRNIVRGEASWILEDNTMMNRGAETMNGDLYKKYRVYEKDLVK